MSNDTVKSKRFNRNDPKFPQNFNDYYELGINFDKVDELFSELIDINDRYDSYSTERQCEIKNVLIKYDDYLGKIKHVGKISYISCRSFIKNC